MITRNQRITALGLFVAMGFATITGATFAQEQAEAETHAAQKRLEQKQASSAMGMRAYMKKDYTTAYKLFEAGEREDGFLLFQLGLMDMTGEGTARDLGKAKSRFQRSCNLNFELACTALENLAKRGM